MLSWPFKLLRTVLCPCFANQLIIQFLLAITKIVALSMEWYDMDLLTFYCKLAVN
jgi:hypothetical protein